MASAPNSPESTTRQDIMVPGKPAFSEMLHLPRNVYLLLFFTTGKGFQLSLSALTLNYYVHSLGYQPDFIGVFSAMPAIGALVSAVLLVYLQTVSAASQSCCSQPSSLLFFWRRVPLSHPLSGCCSVPLCKE